MDQGALPELDWSDFKGRIPDDVFKFGENIPRQFLPQTTKAEDSMGVVVMEIYDISKFWFYLRKFFNASFELLTLEETWV